MNIVAVTRLISNIAVFTFVALVTLMIVSGTIQSGLTWAWVGIGIGLTAAAAQLLVSIMAPKQARAAWDEQVLATERVSYVWGYWAALAAFMIMLVLTLSGRMDATLAFFLMGLPLGAAPAGYMILAYLRGRAG